MMDPQYVFEIGKRNYLAMRRDPVEGRNPVARRSGRRRQFANRAAGDRHRQTLAAGGRHAAGTVPGVPAERGKRMAYRVLIVDDSPAMRSFVRRVIRLSGFELSACLEASNGQEALDLLAARVGGCHPHRYQHAQVWMAKSFSAAWPRTSYSARFR